MWPGSLRRLGAGWLQKPGWGTPCTLGVCRGRLRVSCYILPAQRIQPGPILHPVMGAKGTRRGHCSVLPTPTHCREDLWGAGHHPSVLPSILRALASLTRPVSVQSLLCTIGHFTQ